MAEAGELTTVRVPWLRSLRAGAWALADQWLFSGANFIANILLARWLAPSDYGAFAFAFSLFLLFGALHTAALADPMLVFGAGRYKTSLGAYLKFLLRLHWGFSLGTAALLALGAWLAMTANEPSLPAAIGGAALSAPFVLLAWLLRRVFYIDSQPAKAALTSGLYFVTMLAALTLLQTNDALSPFNAFVAIGAASLLVSVLALILLRSKFGGSSETIQRREMLAEQWNYSRWSGLTSFLIWIPLNIFFVILPYSSSLAVVGALRALTNLLTPLMQSTLAITVLLLPQLSASFQKYGAASLWPRLRTALLGFLAVGALYWAMLRLFGESLLGLLYGAQYSASAELIWLAAVVPIPFGVGVLLETGLRAMEQPRRVFYGYLAASLAACTLGMWLTFTYGLAGALIGQAIAFAMLAIVLLRQFRS